MFKQKNSTILVKIQLLLIAKIAIFWPGDRMALFYSARVSI